MQSSTLASLVGREREVEALREFLLGDGGAGEASMLEGPTGIGKTSVWRAGVEAAREDGSCVRLSRPSAQDSLLAFVGLADLLDGIDLGALHGLPEAQLSALENAIQIRDDGVADAQLVYTAFLAALRLLARDRRVIVAVDDLQWLDQASATALAFAARRLEHDDVRFLFTLRLPDAGGVAALLEAALPIDRLPVVPMTLGAVGHLLHTRLALTLPRTVTHRVYEISGGNPLFALELGRALRGQKRRRGIDGGLPLPDRLEGILAERVDALSVGARHALLAVSLSRGASTAEIVAVVGQPALDDADHAGVVTVEDDHVRPAHPLLGEVAKSRVHPRERRHMHRQLAEVVPDQRRQALHLSQAAAGPDAPTAAIVSRVAAQAAARGAVASAAELGERALQLTPADDQVLLERRLDAAEYLYMSGDSRRAVEVLPALDSLPPGPDRARAALLRGGVAIGSADVIESDFRVAVADTPYDSRIGALARIRLANNLAVGRLYDLRQALALAEEGLAGAVKLGDPLIQNEGFATVIWCRAMLGMPLDGQLARAAATAEGWLYYGTSRAEGVHLMWRGRLTEARAVFDPLLALADERGEGEAYVALRVQVCELELRAAGWARVASLVQEWQREPRESVGYEAALLRLQAFLALGRGAFSEAEELALRGIRVSDEAKIPWHGLECRRALGIARLVNGDAARACEELVELRNRLRAPGVDNPGAFPLAPDLIQALCLTGHHERAAREHATLVGQASSQGNLWAGAAAERAQGYLHLAAGDDAAAAPSFERAAGRFAGLGMPLDQARALTALGVAQRRLRRRRDARQTLERAVALLESIGSPGWAELARIELARVGGRRPAGAQLTATERRVAELVVSGLANKQVAAALVVSVGTVEAHLTRIYAKLGVRSRTELVRALAGN